MISSFSEKIFERGKMNAEALPPGNKKAPSEMERTALVGSATLLGKLLPPLALSENGGEPPKRRQWRMKRGGEVKKQGESRSASSERGDYVSEGVVPRRGGCGDRQDMRSIKYLSFIKHIERATDCRPYVVKLRFTRVAEGIDPYD